MAENDNSRMMTLEEFWESGEFLKQLEPNGQCELCQKIKALEVCDLEELHDRHIELFDHLAGLYCSTYDLHRYVVEIEEKYHKTVAVYASSIARAEEIADGLCDSGVIDMEKNTYAGRSFDTVGGTSRFDSSGPDQYIEGSC